MAMQPAMQPAAPVTRYGIPLDEADALASLALQ